MRARRVVDVVDGDVGEAILGPRLEPVRKSNGKPKKPRAKALVATNFDDHHEQIACKLFNKLNEGTFGNATELTLDQFRTLSQEGEKVHDKTLLAALASTGEVDKIDIDEIDAVKALVARGEVAWVCSPLFVKKVKAACDAHSDARLGVLRRHAIDSTSL